jgi:hypothetical protein
MKKKGAMELSFGMIFSIILIIIFLVFAFYGIQRFLNLQKEVQIKQFENDLQEDVNRLWKGNQGSEEVSYFLPTYISKVCFKQEEFEKNLFYQTSKEIDRESKIEHLDLDKIVGTKKAYCIDTNEGKINLLVKKDYGDALVTISE